MNLITHINLAIYFHRCGHKESFSKLYVNLGVNIGESLSFLLKIMYKRGKY